MYNGICSAWVNVEHILFLSVSNRGLGSVVCIVGIGFALLAHPWLGILSKKSQPPSVFVPAQLQKLRGKNKCFIFAVKKFYDYET